MCRAVRIDNGKSEVMYASTRQVDRRERCNVGPVSLQQSPIGKLADISPELAGPTMSFQGHDQRELGNAGVPSELRGH